MFDKRGILTLLVCCVLAAGIAVADQLVKAYIVGNFRLDESNPWFRLGGKEIINLTYVLNSGAAFSSFSGRRILLVLLPVLLTLVCLAGILYYARQSRLATAGITIVMGGGIGNLIDRVCNNGEVIDYLEVRLFHFAIFNLADVCICVGVAVTALYLLILEPRAARRQAAAAAAGAQHD